MENIVVGLEPWELSLLEGAQSLLEKIAEVMDECNEDDVAMFAADLAEGLEDFLVSHCELNQEDEGDEEDEEDGDGCNGCTCCNCCH